MPSTGLEEVPKAMLGHGVPCSLSPALGPFLAFPSSFLLLWEAVDCIILLLLKVMNHLSPCQPRMVKIPSLGACRKCHRLWLSLVLRSK